MTDNKSPTQIIAEHANRGCWRQQGGNWASVCRCEKHFIGTSFSEAIEGHASHVASVLNTPIPAEIAQVDGVIQADRDAAADIWRDYIAKTGEIIVERNMRKGGLDDCLPNLLHRHRLAHTDQSARVMALEITDEQVRDAMQTAWDEICSDANAHPDDIYRVGRKTYFRAGTWADYTAMHLRALTGKDGR